jgi:hypothetical protein
MNRYILSLLLVADVGICATPISAVTFDYTCEKGSKIIRYRVAFKDEESTPPCKVYQLYQGEKTKRIAHSQKNARVCEDALDRILSKLEKQGMHCYEEEGEFTQ